MHQIKGRTLPSPFFGLLGLWFAFSPPFGPTAITVFQSYAQINDTVHTGRVAMLVLFVLSCFFYIAFDVLSQNAKNATIAACSVVCSIGMVLLSLPALGAPIDLIIAGSALRGLVDGLILLAWMSLLSKLRGQGIGIALSEALVAYAIAVTAIPEVAEFSPALAGVLLAACPLASGIGYMIAAKDSLDSSEPRIKQEPLSIKYQVLFVLNNILYSTILGILMCEVFKITYDLVALSLVLFAAILFLIFILYSKASDYGRGFRAYSVVAAIALLLCAITYDVHPNITISAVMILWGLQIFFNTMIFADIQFTLIGYSINSGSVGLASMGVGLLIATLLPIGNPTEVNIHIVIAAIFVTIVYTDTLFLPREGRWTSNWGFAGYSLPESNESFLTRRCDEVVEEFNLTKREAEVAELLAQGMRTDDISEKLFISPLTTKTHLRNMYAKMDIHSQSEFIDLLENGKNNAEASSDENNGEATPPPARKINSSRAAFEQRRFVRVRRVGVPLCTVRTRHARTFVRPVPPRRVRRSIPLSAVRAQAR